MHLNPLKVILISFKCTHGFAPKYINNLCGAQGGKKFFAPFQEKLNNYPMGQKRALSDSYVNRVSSYKFV